MSANALELARHGVPKQPLYLTGQVGGKPVSIHAEGERVILTGPAGTRQEIDLAAARTSADRSSADRRSESTQGGAGQSAEAQLPEPICPAAVLASGIAADAEPAPGTSPLDDGLRRIAQSLGAEGGDA